MLVKAQSGKADDSGVDHDAMESAHTFTGGLMKSSSCSLVATLLLLFPAAAGNAAAAAGDPIWTDVYDPAGNGTASARTVLASPTRLYVSGGYLVDQPNGAAVATLLRTYDSKTGKLLWADNGSDLSVLDIDKLALNGRRVFAAGYAAGPGTDTDFLVRAYDTRNGSLLWDKRYDAMRRADLALGVAANSVAVVAAGSVSPNAFDLQTAFAVRAYSPGTGQLLWYDRYTSSGTFDAARSVALRGHRAFVVGRVDGGTTNRDLLVRSYDAQNGNVVWEDRYDRAPLDDSQAIAVSGPRVLVAGDYSSLNVGGGTFVRAYSTQTGRLLWEYVSPLYWSAESTAIATSGTHVLVVGGIADYSTEIFDGFVQCFDVRTGTLVWEKRIDFSGKFDWAQTVAVTGSLVVVGGLTADDTDYSDGFVRTYDLGSGTALWTDRWGQDGVGEYANSVAIERNEIFAVGSRDVTNGIGFAVRAYATK